ncbi:hypothetical protein QTN24_20605 [Cupriavidus sp. SZY C1]|uniref:hypothetical protein n=1 Tax=Cupriavidus sp. SZY C1 TaxID=3055037 RepID=UPI0028BBA17C|nr:hypothetical protein [Cupriavidus sp. SZY C1]MDT6963911.1 hypothetical protein [Cupriavidus sp. SZY C1]
MADHDAVVRLYATQIVEKADAAQQGEPVSALATSEIDKAMMHFRTLDGGRSTGALLRQLVGALREAAGQRGRAESARLVILIAADYASEASQGHPGGG